MAVAWGSGHVSPSLGGRSQWRLNGVYGSINERIPMASRSLILRLFHPKGTRYLWDLLFAKIMKKSLNRTRVHAPDNLVAGGLILHTTIMKGQVKALLEKPVSEAHQASRRHSPRRVTNPENGIYATPGKSQPGMCSLSTKPATKSRSHKKWPDSTLTSLQSPKHESSTMAGATWMIPQCCSQVDQLTPKASRYFWERTPNALSSPGYLSRHAYWQLAWYTGTGIYPSSSSTLPPNNPRSKIRIIFTTNWTLLLTLSHHTINLWCSATQRRLWHIPCRIRTSRR